MKLLEQHKCFGGALAVYEHDSAALSCAMRFSVFLPPAAQGGETLGQAAGASGRGAAAKKPQTKFPFLTFLAGITSTYENFTVKGGAYRMAAECGLAIIAPDTSPRGADVPDDAGWDLGQGAGFYINAQRQPWAKHYRMETYIAQELNQLACEALPLNAAQQGIMGHSMGGHGALSLGLKYPQLYRSISAFAPIASVAQSALGRKALAAYLGTDAAEWQNHDACALMARSGRGQRSAFPEILLDQGTEDEFLRDDLKPDLFADACRQAGQRLKLRMQLGYDHGYYFVQSFIADHLRHHARILRI